MHPEKLRNRGSCGTPGKPALHVDGLSDTVDSPASIFGFDVAIDFVAAAIEAVGNR